MSYPELICQLQKLRLLMFNAMGVPHAAKRQV